MGENAGVLGIPDDAEVIAPYACSVYALNQLKKLTLGASLKRICTHAFGENKLKTLRIPAALERRLGGRRLSVTVRSRHGLCETPGILD